MCDGYAARAEVTSKHSNEGYDLVDYDAFLIDYGNISRVGEVAKLPATFAHPPALGIRFQMSSPGAAFPAVFCDVVITTLFQFYCNGLYFIFYKYLLILKKNPICIICSSNIN